MSFNYNHSVLVGRLTKDPDYKEFSATFCRTSFYLAVNRPFKKAQTDFIPVALYGRNAKTAERILKKGMPVLVCGRIQVRTYDQDSQKRWITELVGDNFQVLERIEIHDSDEEDMELVEGLSEEVNKEIVDQTIREVAEEYCV